MGMFSRINDIVQASLNAMLDKAEEHEKIIRMIIQEMEETLVEVRSDAARFIAEQKTLNRQLLAVNKEVNNWQRKAQLAMDNDKESLAKAALVEKHKYVDKAAAINEQLTQLSESIEKLQIDTARLNEKMREAKQKQKALITRKQTVSARLKVKTSQNSTKIDDAMMRFEHYEQRIDHLEAQVEAYHLPEKTVSLNEEFADLERDETIENELAELKKSKVA